MEERTDIARRKAYNDGYSGKESPGGRETSPGLTGVLYRLWKKGKDDKDAGKPYDQEYSMVKVVPIGPQELQARPVPLPSAPAGEGGRKRRKTKKTKGKRKAKKTTTRRR